MQAKALVIKKELGRLYPEIQPFLCSFSNYTLLVSVILSARCTDEQVNKVTKVLFAQADTPEKMLRLSYETLYEIVRPCGLGPFKAKSILMTSERLLSNFQGEVPRDLELLESLPGVGHKTAAVVANLAFNIPAFPVDTHIRRLALRWGLSLQAKNIRKLEQDLKKLYPPKDWKGMHLRMIRYGREHCPARGCRPSCTICPKLGIL